MTELPFQLSIKTYEPKQQERSVLCKRLLRSIKGVRSVYDAIWGQKEVIVKIFSDRLNAARHLKREWDGFNRLRELGIDCPQPLFFGKTPDGSCAIVTEKIGDSTTALDIFEKAESKDEKLNILILIVKHLAGQNDKGVYQNDFHLGNFLVWEGKVYAIDPAQMRFYSRKLPKAESISQLALAACCLYQYDADYIRRLAQSYYDEREWEFEEKDITVLLEAMRRHRKTQVKKGLKKTLRTSKRQVLIKKKGLRAVFEKGFAENIEPEDFIEGIDSLMDSGRVLKKGNTCYVSQLRYNGKDIVIKRYNYKGFIHSVRNTIKGSRARRGWLFGHLMGMLGAATPKPLAFIEKRRGRLIVKSYFITEFVEGTKLCDLLKDSQVSEQKRRQVKQQVIGQLDRLADYRITHGDLKHTNIIVTDKGVVLSDLDSMQIHKTAFTYKLYRTKDISLFAHGKRDGDLIFDDLI